MNNELGAIIRKLRTRSQIKQVVFAKEIGVTQTFISEVERGRKRPSIATVERMADVLSVTPLKIIELAAGSKKKDDVIGFIFKYFK